MNGQSNQPFIVRAHGEIDLDAAPSLRRALATALESHREVVLDLSEVTFMDCAGLGALVRARNHADRSSRRLVLRGATALWDVGAVLSTVADAGGDGLTGRVLLQLPPGYHLLFGRPTTGTRP